MERKLLLQIPMKPSSLYIAGPMAGIEDLNYPLFYRVEEALNAIDIETINPAELDRLDTVHWMSSIQPSKTVPTTTVTPLLRAGFLKRDFHYLTTMEGIVLLEGWEDSTGANAELMVAQLSGMNTWLWVDGLYPEPNLTADLDLIFAHINEVVWGVADGN